MAQDYSSWIDKLGVGKVDLGRMIQQIMSSVGTQTAQGQNTLESQFALSDAPEATKLAGKRGMAYQGQLATGKGIADVESKVAGMNRQAWGQIFGANVQAEQAELQREMQEKMMWAQALGGLFQGLGDIGGSYAGK